MSSATPIAGKQPRGKRQRSREILSASEASICRDQIETLADLETVIRSQADILHIGTDWGNESLEPNAVNGAAYVLEKVADRLSFMSERFVKALADTREEERQRALSGRMRKEPVPMSIN